MCLWLWVSVLLIHSLAPISCTKPSHPNILLISLDACRADHLSSYGYNRPTSPFLDDLAARGIRFSRAFANTLGTTPSHATLLSSLYQATHGVELAAADEEPVLDRLRDSVTMLQELLRQEGYRTLAVTDGANMSKRFGSGPGV